MSDPYETRRPWPYWAAMQKETLDKMGFTDEWRDRMTRKQEIERLIELHEQALKLLTESNPKLYAAEIDKKEKDLAALRMQLQEAA